jgi:hypothetical protein
MSIIGQQLAESKLRQQYFNKATKKKLIACIMEHHIPEDEHYQGVHGNFLKDSWPRRCKTCGDLLFPDKWEPVEEVESNCKHETVGYYHDVGNYKTCNRFPQKCKHCGIDLKPKTWKPWKEEIMAAKKGTQKGTKKKKLEAVKPGCLKSKSMVTAKAQEMVNTMYEGNGPFKADLRSFIRSRIPSFTVQTNEEKRFICYMSHMARTEGYRVFIWDMVSGLRTGDTFDKVEMDNTNTRQCASDHERVLAYIYNEHENMQRQHAEQYKKQGYNADIYILLDFRHMLREPRIVRRLKNLAYVNSFMSSIMVGDDIAGHHYDHEMECLIPNLNAPKPGDDEIRQVFDEMVEGVIRQIPDIEEQIKKDGPALLKELRGKTLIEAQRIVCNNLTGSMTFIGK